MKKVIVLFLIISFILIVSIPSSAFEQSGENVLEDEYQVTDESNYHDEIAATGSGTYSLNVGSPFILQLSNLYSRYAISSKWIIDSGNVQILREDVTQCEIKATSYTSGTIRIICEYRYKNPSAFQEILTDVEYFYIKIKNDTGGGDSGGGNSGGGNSGGGESGEEICTVTLDPNGGTVPYSSIKFIRDHAVGYLPTPSRSDYSFVGWYTGPSGGTRVYQNTEFGSNITVYAHWKSDYNLVFDPNGGGVSPSSKEIQKGCPIGELPTPSRSGFIFDGWFSKRDGGNEISSSTIYYSEYNIIYAHWTKIVSIDNVAISGITPPKPDECPVFSAAVANTANYIVSPINSRKIKNGVAWYDVTAKKWMTSIDTFSKCNEYYVYVYLEPKYACAFYNAPKAIINGNSANASSPQSDGSVCVTYLFREKDVWDGSVAGGYDSGTGRAYDPYVIRTASQLAYFAERCNSGNTYKGKYFSLACDIDLNHIEWTPIGDFSGTFNGAGYIIYNLKIGNKDLNHSGLFGDLTNATVKKLGVQRANINTVWEKYVYSGIICGAAKDSVISECYANGAVFVCGCSETSNCCVGAGIIAGYISGTTVSDCYGSGKIHAVTSNKGIAYAGGLTGIGDNSTVKNSFFIGEVLAGGYNSSYAGGLLGHIEYTDTKISNSFIIGEVIAENGTKRAGTIIPDSAYAPYSVLNCYYDINNNAVPTVQNGNCSYHLNMQSRSWLNTNLSWDSNTIWNFRDNGYPTLRVFKLYDDVDCAGLCGDADGNGEIETVDATLVQRYVAQIDTPYTKYQLLCGDVDGNGKLELIDATYIQRFLVDLKTKFPLGTVIS